MDIGISFIGVVGLDSLEGYFVGIIWIGLSVKGYEIEVF